MSFLLIFLRRFFAVAPIFFYRGSSLFTFLRIYAAISLIFNSNSFGLMILLSNFSSLFGAIETRSFSADDLFVFF